MEFQFVNSTMSSPSVPQDQEIRALIRKQAMKKASAARRRDGNYGKHNLRQYPVFIYDQENIIREPSVRVMDDSSQSSSSDSPSPPRLNSVATLDGAHIISSTHGKIDARIVIVTSTEAKHERSLQTKKDRGVIERQRWLSKLALAESLSTGMSAKGYELTSIKSDFDILDLSTLATLHVGRFTRAALSQNPEHLKHQLRSKYDPQLSYLSFLPSRYDQIGCLSDAVDCVIARARYIVSPNKNWEAAVISFYVKALYSLQKALDCSKQRFKPEVLCATEILALYELLDPSGETAWVRHTAGAARLLQLRGSKSYNTDFEKSLFMAHTVPIITESLFNGHRCFLELKAWQKVFVSCIQETPTLTDRSEIVMSLLMLKCFIPGKFADVTDIMCKPGQVGTPDIDKVESRTRHLHGELKRWHIRYQAMVRSSPKVQPGTAEYDAHSKVYATYICCMIITTRLLAALSPRDRCELEQAALVLADQMFRLEDEVRVHSLHTSLFLAQTLGVSASIQMTTADWDGSVKPEHQEFDDSAGIVSWWKFKRWNDCCGRKWLS